MLGFVIGVAWLADFCLPLGLPDNKGSGGKSSSHLCLDHIRPQPESN